MAPKRWLVQVYLVRGYGGQSNYITFTDLLLLSVDCAYPQPLLLDIL